MKRRVAILERARNHQPVDADLVTAAIPMGAMYKLNLDHAETGQSRLPATCAAMMGGAPDRNAKASPDTCIDQIRGHLLIAHGLADSTVSPEHAHVAVRELTAAGIPHEVMLFDNEGHGILRRTNVETYLMRAAVFLEHALAEGIR